MNQSRLANLSYAGKRPQHDSATGILMRQLVEEIAFSHYSAQFIVNEETSFGFMTAAELHRYPALGIEAVKRAEAILPVRCQSKRSDVARIDILNGNFAFLQ